jgi:hypothetical protein
MNHVHLDLNAVATFNAKQELKFAENLVMLEILVMLQENAKTICNVKEALKYVGDMESWVILVMLQESVQMD